MCVRKINFRHLVVEFQPQKIIGSEMEFIVQKVG